MVPRQASDARWHRAAVALVAVGLFLRAYHFLGDPSLWFDEAAVVLNVLDKDYAALTGPLDHSANGPVLFLWMERFLFTWLGDAPAVYRAPALVASCLGLVAFFLVARRALPAPAAACAVGLFALSDRLLWHTVEVRPYTIDVLIAVGVVWAWLWTESWSVTSRILLFTAAGPVMLLASYPAVFVCCGPALLLLRDAWKDRRAGPLLAYGLFAVALAATGLWLLQGPIRAQHQGMAASGFTWSDQMPDWSRADKALKWPVSAPFEVLRYCLRPTGGLLLAFAVIGAVCMVRTGRGQLAALLLIPLGAAMGASALHRYPCGGGRPMLFFTPSAALLIGAAVPVVLRACARFGEAPEHSAPVRTARRGFAGAVALAGLLLVLTPMAVSLYRVAVPWPRLQCRETAAHVLEHRRPDDAVAVCTWDQIYFYRHLDTRWQCGLSGPVDPARNRFWLTVNATFQGEQHAANLSRAGWTVAERYAFGELVVFLFVRSGARTPDASSAIALHADPIRPGGAK